MRNISAVTVGATLKWGWHGVARNGASCLRVVTAQSFSYRNSHKQVVVSHVALFHITFWNLIAKNAKYNTKRCTLWIINYTNNRIMWMFIQHFVLYLAFSAIIICFKKKWRKKNSDAIICLYKRYHTSQVKKQC